MSALLRIINELPQAPVTFIIAQLFFVAIKPVKANALLSLGRKFLTEP
jgi:hypothetical protein